MGLSASLAKTTYRGLGSFWVPGMSDGLSKFDFEGGCGLGVEEAWAEIDITLLELSVGGGDRG